MSYHALYWFSYGPRRKPADILELHSCMCSLRGPNADFIKVLTESCQPFTAWPQDLVAAAAAAAQFFGEPMSMNSNLASSNGRLSNLCIHGLYHLASSTKPLVHTVER